MYLVLYDIADPVRLKKAAKLIKRYGTRIQKSVFECRITDSRFAALRTRLIKTITKEDSVIYYKLGDQISNKKIP